MSRQVGAGRRISDDMIERAKAIDLLDEAQRLGAKLKRVGAGEHVGACVVCGGRDRFSVNTAKKVWFCRYCGKGGNDALSLVAHVRGLDLSERGGEGLRKAIEEITGEEAEVERKRSPAPAAVISPKAISDDDARNLRSAARIVSELIPLKGTLGERYLAEFRAIDTSAIRDVLERTDAVGWHEAVYFNEEGHALHGRKLGAIIGIMSDPITAKPTGAVSRTYLGPDGTKLGKARTLAVPAGIIRLTPDEDTLAGLHIGEGLETAADLLSQGFAPMWAMGSTALMAKFPVLGGIEHLTIFADRDDNGAGEIAAREAEARWQAAGREVRIWRRKNGLGDFNDATRAAR
jgi:putative DNA primase/helicase